MGTNVGASVGAVVGEAEGAGVGLPAETRSTTVEVAVAAVEIVTFLEDLYTAVTVVPIDTPVPDTDAPRLMEDVLLTVMFVDPLTMEAFTAKVLVAYVGVSVGIIVGELLGDMVGCGVGLPDLYVGTCVGTAVGDTVGEAVGAGEGTAAP